MTNEELVVLIQSGERGKLMELWEQVRRMALKEAAGWAAYRSNGVELDDLEQAGFIALIRAVDSFDPSAGTRFSTWHYHFMKDEFQQAAGRRTEKQRRDPLDAAVSLDAPITKESDDIFWGDTISDPGAEAAMADVDRREDLRRLYAALEAAIATLLLDLQTAVWGRYCRREIVDASACGKALRMLRVPKCSQMFPNAEGVLVMAATKQRPNCQSRKYENPANRCNATTCGIFRWLVTTLPNHKDNFLED